MENLIKCYCGHTTVCDCIPEQEKSYREEEVIWALLLCSNKKFKNSLEVKEWWNNFKSK